MYFLILGIDYINNFNKFCMLILIISYFFLIITVSKQNLNFNRLKYVDFGGFFFIFPFLITSFGFHNVIPTIKVYFDDKNYYLFKKVIQIGILIPFFIYIVWIFFSISAIPLYGFEGILFSLLTDKITNELLESIFESKFIFIFSSIFVFFAILTSILSQSVSMFDFLIDGLKLNNIKFGKYISCFFVLFPTFIMSIVNTNIFFIALEYAGGLAAVILFGFLPGIFVFFIDNHSIFKFSIFDKFVAFIIILVSIFFFILQLMKNFNLINLTPIILKDIL